MFGGRGPYCLEYVTTLAQKVEQVAMGTVLDYYPKVTLHAYRKEITVEISIVYVIYYPKFFPKNSPVPTSAGHFSK